MSIFLLWHLCGRLSADRDEGAQLMNGLLLGQTGEPVHSTQCTG